MGIRVQEGTDWTAIDAIYQAAFKSSAEADLVRNLDADGDLILSLIAYGEEAAGHIAFSPLTFEEAAGLRGCALAPLATIPAYQGQGVGSNLITQGLQRVKEMGYDIVVVLGEPDYYSRFGFTPDLAGNLKTPYDGPYLQALALSEHGKAAHGSVTYARAFAELN